MPICTFCRLETGGCYYTRPDGSRGFCCADEPCWTKGAVEYHERRWLEREWAEPRDRQLRLEL